MTRSAEMIIVNGRILTMDEDKPRAEAVAIADGRVLAVGDTAAIEALAGSDTRIVDARNATVLPGFIESHIHLFLGAIELEHLQLAGVKGFDGLSSALSAYADAHPDDAMLIGQGCDYSIIATGEPLTRQHLDRIVPDRPVMLVAADHHTAWANTVALERAGILDGKALNPGNEIVMADDGRASGELREMEAMAPVMGLAGLNRSQAGIESGREPDPAPTAAEREADKAVLRRGLAHAASHGITSFHNMDGNLYQLELLEEIEREGDLVCRAQIPFHFKKPMERDALHAAAQWAERFDSDFLKSGMVKIFMDGVLDSGTAHMIDDYADQSGGRGEAYFGEGEFAELATDIDARGLQIAVHAIGDAAVRTVLDGYEAAQKVNGRRDSRHRVEHIEVTTEDDIPRFAQLGVLASMQPPHVPGAMDFALEPTISKIGRHRWHVSFPTRSIEKTGAHVVFASDWPVSPIDPIAGIRAAVTRQPWADDMPDQSFTLHEALRGYTVEGAYAEFAEDRKGRLREGYFADIVILTDDIEAGAPDEIDAISVAMTICGGRVTYEA